MREAIKKSSLAQLVMQRNLLLFMCILLFFTTLALTVLATRQKTITLFETPKTTLDLKGAESQAQFLTYLILNRSKRNIQEQEATLYHWVDPQFVIPLKTALQKFQNEIEENGSNFEWTLQDSILDKLDETHVRVFLKGTLSLFLPIQNNQKQLVNEEQCTYLVDLILKNGKLLLKDFHKEAPHA